MPLDADATQCVATHQPVANHPRCYCVRWTCVTTGNQAEHYAASNLQRSGYQTYLPLRTIQRPDRAVPSLLHTVTVPLFSRYLFVQHDPATSWGPIRDTPGVRNVIRCGNQLQYVRKGAVSALQAVEALAATQPPKDAQWRPGDAVAPRTGPFQGLGGVVLSAEGEDATVGILFLGQLREVRYPADALVARQDY